jgi:signal transduction histidine kinase
LLRNALQASAGSGAPVSLRARREGDAWMVQVEDAGPGIPEALASRLFLPLTTLGRSGCGTGLPTVFRIVRDHGWDVEHARREGRTVVTVTFAPDDTSHASG